MLALLDAPQSLVDESLVVRVRSEFCEMPGLRLTEQQARRLWALDAQTCDGVLRTLIRDGFLRRTADGCIIRADAR